MRGRGPGGQFVAAVAGVAGVALFACSSGYSLQEPDGGSGTGPDAGTDAGGTDAGGTTATTTPDAATDDLVSNPGKVECGTQLCDLTTELCCRTGPNTFVCQPTSQACGNPARCDEKADCTGNDVCCGAISFGNESSACAATCSGINESQSCRTEAECGGQGCIEQSCFETTVFLCGLNPFCQKL